MLKKTAVFVITLAIALIPSLSLSQVAMSRNGGGSGGGTIGPGSPTDCIVDGAVWRTSTPAATLDCGAGITWSGGTFTLNNGASAVSPLVVQDNGTPVLTVADGGNATFAGQILGSYGTLNLPGISFSANPDTGLFGSDTTTKSVQNAVAWSEVSQTNGFTVPNEGIAFASQATLNSTVTVNAKLRNYASGVLKVGTDGTTIGGFLGGGTAVASNTAMPLPTGRVFHVTGTTTITSITSTNFVSGAVITLIFDDVLTFTDGSNLKLAGDFVTTADDSITLVYDGTNWFEASRSIN